MNIIETATLRKMLRNAGVYPGNQGNRQDPTAVRIYIYTSQLSGKKLFSFFLDKSNDDMRINPFVNDYQLLMEDGKLTLAGETFLRNNP